MASRPSRAPARRGRPLPVLLALSALLAGPAAALPLAKNGDHAGETHAHESHAGERLDDIDLSHANLTSTDLHQTQLKNARLVEALLVGADLSEANLQNADLSGADLTGAVLYAVGAKNAVFAVAVLDGATLSKANLHNANLGDASLRDAVLHEVNAKNAVLTGAALDGADLRGSDVQDAHFANTSLRGTDLRELRNADSADFTGARYDATTLLDPSIDTTGMVFWSEPEPAGGPPVVPAVPPWTLPLLALALGVSGRLRRQPASPDPSRAPSRSVARDSASRLSGMPLPQSTGRTSRTRARIP